MKGLVFILLFITSNAFAQQILYQDMCHCGITGAGFSTGKGFGSGIFQVYIEPGSSIKKAIVLTYSMGYPPPASFVLNDDSIVFDTSHCIMNVSYTSPYATPARLYYKDITSLINPAITMYNITIPTQPSLPINWGYWSFYLYIVYENPALAISNPVIVTNTQDYIGNESYSINNLNPIDTFYPTGFALYTDRTGSGFVPNERIYFNSALLGIIGGSDNVNSIWEFAGVKGHFYYQNNTLFGLDDDTPDAVMDGTDGLADVSSYLTNNATSCDFQLIDINYPNQAVNATSMNLAYFLTYTTPCDTFTTHLLTSDTSICRGETIQLGASGGTAYAWLPQKDLSCYDCANPVFSGDSTRVYTVRIYNGDSCSKVLPVRVLVHPPPVPTVSITDAFCDPYNGVVQLTQADAAFYTLADDTNTTGVFSNLHSGEYPIGIIDKYGCRWQGTATVGVNSPAEAAFSVNPDSGYSPLTVHLIHEGSGTNTITWKAGGMEAHGLTAQLTFQDTGTFTLAEIACYNEYPCCDTAFATITVFQGLEVIVPNIITPNGDGRNDALVAKVNGVEFMRWQVYNRWGNLLFSDEIDAPAPSVALWKPEESEYPAGVYSVALHLVGRSGGNRKMVVQVAVK